MAYISLAVLHLLYMALQIGRVVLMIASLRVVILSSLVKRRFNKN